MKYKVYEKWRNRIFIRGSIYGKLANDGDLNLIFFLNDKH